MSRAKQSRRTQRALEKELFGPEPKAPKTPKSQGPRMVTHYEEEPLPPPIVASAAEVYAAIFDELPRHIGKNDQTACDHLGYRSVNIEPSVVFVTAKWPSGLDLRVGRTLTDDPVGMCIKIARYALSEAQKEQHGPERDS